MERELHRIRRLERRSRLQRGGHGIMNKSCFKPAGIAGLAEDFLRQMPSGCWIVPCDDSQALGEAIKSCLNAGEMSNESKHNIQETWQALTDALTN